MFCLNSVHMMSDAYFQTLTILCLIKLNATERDVPKTQWSLNTSWAYSHTFYIHVVLEQWNTTDKWFLAKYNTEHWAQKFLIVQRWRQIQTPLMLNFVMLILLLVAIIGIILKR